MINIVNKVGATTYCEIESEMSNRFAQLSEEDKRCLLLSKDSKSTQKGTQVAWLAFKQWSSSKNLYQLDVSRVV